VQWNQPGSCGTANIEAAAYAKAPDDAGGMTDQTDIDWPTCDEDGCIGVRVAAAPKCLAHTSDEQRNATFKQLGETGEIDARGVPITPALLEHILAAAPHDSANHPTFARASFNQATFGDRASFEGATFGDLASFEGATFGDGASFDRATFRKGALFVGATFDSAWFVNVTFGDLASFEGATFGDGALFPGATFDRAMFEGAAFGNYAWFHGATFDSAWFEGATFGDRAQFDGATFDRAMFERVTFGDHTSFERVKFADLVSLDDAKIGDWARLGPVVAKELTLRRAIFGRAPDLVISADRLRCPQAKFPDGGRLRVRWAEVTLDNTDFGRHSVLEAAPASEEFTEIGETELIEDALTGAQTHRTAQPRPICLAGCDVHNLLLVDCDLRACRFAGAHNLAALRLEGTITLPSTPEGWQAAWRTFPPLWRWERRQTIAEEHYWRQLQARSQGWRGAPTRSPSPYVAEWHDRGERGDPSNPYGPPEIAGVYRALRKGREDNKDEPGAADFYYGEMEMRRHARGNASNRPGTRPRGRVERGILTAYWLVSGYGLRAWRALAWLAILTAAFAVAFHLIGFTNPPQPDSYWTSLLYSFRATLSLTDDDVKLTAWGKLLQALLRISGPLLLGLALLAVRGRVKR
jgi:uncharacterized protein YjbI with pentapeptide repeats